MLKHPLRALAFVALVASTAGAQSTYPYQLPRPVTWAGACTGSTNGGGMNFAGGSPTQQDYAAGGSLCDIKEGLGPQSTTSQYPGVAPQDLEAHASLNWGEIRTYARENIVNWQNQGLYFPRAFGQAGWSDDIVIDAPGYTGQAGSTTGSVHISGLLESFGYQGNAGYGLAIMLGSTYPAAERHLWIGGGQGNSAFQSILIDEVVQVAVNFIYGTPFAVGVFGYSFAANSSEGGSNYLPGYGLSDFENTMQWTGLSSVMANGNVVSNYTVTSASGDDWILGPDAQAVPEPSTVALMATGLLVLAAARRRRA